MSEKTVVLTDMTTREDVVRLVNVFYERLRKDELLAPVFSNVNWDEHLHHVQFLEFHSAG